MAKKRKKNRRGSKTTTQSRDAQRTKENNHFVGGGRGMPSDEEPTGGVLHHSPRKVGSDGIPVYGRTLISPGAMAILLRKKRR